MHLNPLEIQMDFKTEDEKIASLKANEVDHGGIFFFGGVAGSEIERAF